MEEDNQATIEIKDGQAILAEPLVRHSCRTAPEHLIWHAWFLQHHIPTTSMRWCNCRCLGMSPMDWQMLQMCKVSAHSTFTHSCFFSIPMTQ